MIDKSLVDEFVEELKTKKFKMSIRSPRDFKESGFRRRKFGWKKKKKDGTVVYYNEKQEKSKHE